MRLAASLLVAFYLALVCCLTVASADPDPPAEDAVVAPPPPARDDTAVAARYRARALTLERQLHAARRTVRRQRRTIHEQRKLLVRRWRHLQALRRKYRLAPLGLPPHYGEWLCIHRGEGAWNSNTGNGYYGGLQMDWSFMRSYGSALLRAKGTANNWTPLEQMWVAEKAHASGRGFYPWPSTARMCGLI